MEKIILVFDFDGVLVDSYSKLEEVYIEALREHPIIKKMSIEEIRRLARELVRLEDYYDSTRQYDRFKLIETFLSSRNFILDENMVKKMVEKYWTKRIEESIVSPDAEETLREFYGKHILILLTDHDGVPGMKLKRVKTSKLDKYFNEIIVAGEPGYIADKRKGLGYIVERYNVKPAQIVFIDDKPRVLAYVKDLGIITILRRFKPSNMELSWKGEIEADYTVYSLTELVKIINKLEHL